MIITISSHQMGARKTILNFVSKRAPFLKSESEITTVLLQGTVRLHHEEFEQEQD